MPLPASPALLLLIHLPGLLGTLYMEEHFQTAHIFFKKSTCSVMAHPAPPTPRHMLPRGRGGKRFSLHWKTALCTLKYHRLESDAIASYKARNSSSVPVEQKRTNFPISQQSWRHSGVLSPAITQSVTGKILRGEIMRFLVVIFYIMHRCPGTMSLHFSKVKTKKHFAETKRIILHLPFSKSLKTRR